MPTNSSPQEQIKQYLNDAIELIESDNPPPSTYIALMIAFFDKNRAC